MYAPVLFRCAGPGFSTPSARRSARVSSSASCRSEPAGKTSAAAYTSIIGIELSFRVGRLMTAREKAADACGCQDVPSHPSADERLKEGFGAGREIRERRQRQRSIERINREHVLMHRRIQLRRRAGAIVLEVGAAEVVVDLKPKGAAGHPCVLGELGGGASDIVHAPVRERCGDVVG